MINKPLKEELIQGVEALELTYSAQQVDTWLAFLGLLQKWNNAYNLTAIKNSKDMLTHHLLDSLAIAPYLNKTRHIDVGTGAGLPGVPLAILHPTHHFTLLDSNGKKTRFIEHAKHQLGLENISVVHHRAESYQPDTLFETVITRAFASISEMLQTTSALCAKEGIFLAMRGKTPEKDEPLPQLFTLKKYQPLIIPGLNAKRHILIIAKKASN